MAVGVDVYRAVVMAVAMKMHAVAPETPEHVSTEPDQHDADGGLQWTRDMFGDRVAEQQRSTRKDEQGQRMAETPGQAMADDIADMAAARGDARHRRDMVGFQRVLHAQQKPEPQNSEHVSPACSPVIACDKREAFAQGSLCPPKPAFGEADATKQSSARQAGLLRCARNDGLNDLL